MTTNGTFLGQLLKGTAISGAIAVSTVGLAIGYASAVQASFQDSPKAMLDEAWQIVNREYVDENFNNVDWQAVRTDLLSREYTSKEEAYAALREALGEIGDSYTRFMDPREYQALLNQTSGELSGVGIRLQVDPATQVLMIVEPIPNSPAVAAGLQAGDYILEIDGQSTEGMTVQEASERIRGELGTAVDLRIERSAEEFEVSLVRQRIELPTVTYRLQTDNGYRIGYIRLREFSSHAAEQMSKAILDLSEQNVEGFVLDLRGNPGGLLQASIDIARMWLDSGAIVRTVNRHNTSEEIKATHTALTQKPLVVLVDQQSASSSEILTGALMDNNRATVVGAQTFGKALVQSVHSLSDGSGIAVTVAHYYTPLGTDINQQGITPDIEISLSSEDRRRLADNPGMLATSEDPQYVRAIATLEPALIVNRNVAPTQVGQSERSPALMGVPQ
jgi:carboxyl-terminal processing protease